MNILEGLETIRGSPNRDRISNTRKDAFKINCSKVFLSRPYKSLSFFSLALNRLQSDLRTSLRENREKLEMRIRNAPSFFAWS